MKKNVFRDEARTMKIIANYLPQYHQTPYNDKWWGDGYTDWVAVKKAKPLFEGHQQPRIPMNENYYALDDVEALQWQAKLAEEYGIYGFGIYHYWFSEEQNLLNTPARMLLEEQDIDINFMFIWDNDTWRRSWSAIQEGNSWAITFEGNPAEMEKRDNGVLAEL